jgi:hypothetical protein
MGWFQAPVVEALVQIWACPPSTNSSMPASRELGEQRLQELIGGVAGLRKHGVPNFPDPTFPSGGGISWPIVPGLDLRSPAVNQAGAGCSRH